MNRLGQSLSPYLLQHADNPVDWWPWCDDAFETARREDKPVLLSVGYATCHWCHVMAHESFEDPIVARLMNNAFVNIKVDREERPDIDGVYMTTVQMLTGAGGWPMTVVMTPDKRPFFAATYIPKMSQFGRLGMMDLIPRIDAAWRDDRAKLLEGADQIVANLHHLAALRPEDSGGVDVIEQARRDIGAAFDPVEGGFGTAPKFPSPHLPLFLLAYGEANDNPEAVEMAAHTLERMRRGGVFDQLGFGFHRYSTDRTWLVPHFEKMLYDQAMLTLAYAEAHRLTGRPNFAATARETIEYVLRDLAAPEGGFYSAEDADSEGEEGAFYVWTEEALRAILDADDLSLVRSVWNTSPEGNFTPEHGSGSSGANILHLKRDLDRLAEASGQKRSAFLDRLDAVRRALLRHRSQRPRPQLDDKVLTDWNGLMAAALARTGFVLDDPSMINRARKTLAFLLSTMRRADGRLLHSYRSGTAGIPGFLDDHACVVWALLELFDATLEPTHLEQAVALQDDTDRLFWDAEGGGYFFSAPDNEALPSRPKDLFDGAKPSGNAVCLHNLVRLGRLTGQTRFLERAEALAGAVSGSVAAGPFNHVHLVDGLLRASAPSVEVVICGPRDDPATDALLNQVRSEDPARPSVLLIEPGPEGERIRRLAPFTRSHRMIDDRPTAWVCRDHQCHAPVTDPARLREVLKGDSDADR